MEKPNHIFVLGQKVRLLQPDKGFKTSMDSVLLAASCPVKAQQSVLDMGCGVGAVGLCILRRVPDIKIMGLDIQDDILALARQNAQYNEAADYMQFQCCDIRDFKTEERFDHVVCNPPFLEAGQHIPSPEEGIARARGHQDHDLTIKDWVDGGFHHLKSGGSLTVIHRADAVDRMIQALGKRFGAIEMMPIWPRIGVAAKRVIIRAVKDRKTPATLYAGMVLHNENGDYTVEAEQILRQAQPLF